MRSASHFFIVGFLSFETIYSTLRSLLTVSNSALPFVKILQHFGRGSLEERLMSTPKAGKTYAIFYDYTDWQNLSMGYMAFCSCLQLQRYWLLRQSPKGLKRGLVPLMETLPAQKRILCRMNTSYFSFIFRIFADISSILALELFEIDF
jgi:hypothetical protein